MDGAALNIKDAAGNSQELIYLAASEVQKMLGL